MSTSFKQIEILLANLPYAAEAYDHTGKLVAVNTAWRNMWNWKGKNLPESIIFNNRLVNKTGTLSIIRKIFKEGGSVRTPPVICETGDLEFTKTGIDSVFSFYIYSLKNDDLEGTFVINLTEDVTAEIRKSEEEKESELRKRNSLTVLEMLETERKRVAQELHDVIGQKILLAKLNIELFQKKTSKNSPELKDSVKHLIDISKEIKNIIHSLHPVVIEKYSLIDSLDLLVHEFNDSSGIRTSIKYFGNPEYDNIEIDLNIYRIIQESLNNVAKHSGADKVEIECHFTEKILICSISDNGRGFEPAKLAVNGSKKYNYGIVSMKERANVFGGELTIDSSIGKGTKVYFQIPIPEVKSWKK